MEKPVVEETELGVAQRCHSKARKNLSKWVWVCSNLDW